MEPRVNETAKWSGLDRAVVRRLFAERRFPEGAFRKRWVYALVHYYGVPGALIAVEVPAGAGRAAGRATAAVRADIVIYREPEHTHPAVVIEVKPAGVTDGILQAESYARNLGAPAFAVAAGYTLETFRTGFGKLSERATYSDVSGALQPADMAALLDEVGVVVRQRTRVEDVRWLAERMSVRDGEVHAEPRNPESYRLSLRLHSITKEEVDRLLLFGGKTYESGGRLHWKLQGLMAERLCEELINELSEPLRTEAQAAQARVIAFREARVREPKPREHKPRPLGRRWSKLPKLKKPPKH